MELNEDFELASLLREKRSLDSKIERYIKESTNNVIRFSAKKFVGDLGEYYFFKHADIFKNIHQCAPSNSDCDLIGELKDGFAQEHNLPPSVRIEVKTRYAQMGNNHLFGINCEKFDLLAFVALDELFQCRYIGILKVDDVLEKVDGQKRIRYSDLHEGKRVIWESSEWTEL
ncbi:hypothetical protein FKG96_01195 [Olivibacter sp. LS-1]|uniref:hypothetical protein n=1 Tax=Olivibacter sp. LS-1 TaxID=2592345 RepID=UPI0011EB8F33|nr:hypothetical protein [Olivibacter sp. LS-1]QEK99466.1 hypothetical protein FKG96_01195 [Olivibacter sp. LS-1]